MCYMLHLWLRKNSFNNIDEFIFQNFNANQQPILTLLLVRLDFLSLLLLSDFFVNTKIVVCCFFRWTYRKIYTLMIVLYSENEDNQFNPQIGETVQSTENASDLNVFNF